MKKLLRPYIACVIVTSTTVLYTQNASAGRERDMRIEIERDKVAHYNKGWTKVENVVWQREQYPGDYSGNGAYYNGDIYELKSNNTWVFREKKMLRDTNLQNFERQAQQMEESRQRINDKVIRLESYLDLKRRSPRPGSPLMTAADIEYALFEVKQ
jgi:hypothetical protein